MTELRKNTIANFVGRMFTSVVGFIFVPLYAKYLGMDSFGLVTFYATLLSVFGLINSSLGATLTRELAVLSGAEGKAQEQRDLLRSLEVVFWGLSLAVAAAVVVLAPAIAHHWVKRGPLPVQTVEDAVRFMGLVIAFEFVASFYQGGLMGSQRQVLLNVIRVGAAAVRSIGVVAVLAWVSPTIQAFFLWSLGAGVLQAVVSGAALWITMPPAPRRSAFRVELLKGVWKYTAGIIGINVTVILLNQMDKVVLSKAEELGVLGYYGLAATAAGALYIFIHPLYQAVFPRFSQLVSRGDQAGLTQLYHAAAQWMSVLMLPAAVTIVFFSRQAMFLWTGDPQKADNTWMILSLLMTGTAFCGLWSIPYGLQLAHGWTRLIFGANLVMGIVLLPSLVVLANLWGGVGAALAWMLTNAGFVLVGVPVMHRRLLRGEMGKWYLVDVALPAAGVLAALLAAWRIVPDNPSRMGAVVWLGGAWAAATLAGAALAPEVRSRVWHAIRPICRTRRDVVG